MACSLVAASWRSRGETEAESHEPRQIETTVRGRGQDARPDQRET